MVPEQWNHTLFTATGCGGTERKSGTAAEVHAESVALLRTFFRETFLFKRASRALNSLVNENRELFFGVGSRLTAGSFQSSLLLPLQVPDMKWRMQAIDKTKAYERNRKIAG